MKVIKRSGYFPFSTSNPGSAAYPYDDNDAGNPGVVARADRFTDLLNEIWADNLTGLMWIPRPHLVFPSYLSDGNFNRINVDTLEVMAHLPESHGGFDDWRLPTAPELFTLIDFSRFTGWNQVNIVDPFRSMVTWDMCILSCTQALFDGYFYQLIIEYGILNVREAAANPGICFYCRGNAG